MKLLAAGDREAGSLDFPGVVDIFSLSLNEQFVVGKLCESWSFKWWDYLLRVWYDTRGGCLRVCLV